MSILVIRPQIRCPPELIGAPSPVTLLLKEHSEMQKSKRDRIRVYIFIYHTLKLGDAGVQVSGLCQLDAYIGENQHVPRSTFEGFSIFR